ncbi:MAG TPA: hypothetical protein VND80_09860 [Steroidobacteraceae bacterium]|nr:hypothetical protein [Steroidobacteraceae bacterium]
MAEDRFSVLEEALIRRGVAARYARRAALEIESHFRQCVEETLVRGGTRREAEAHAQEILGSDQVLIDRFANQVELQAWTHRWPRFGFMLAPLMSFAALAAAVMLVLLGAAHLMAGYLHHVRLSIIVTRRIDLAAEVMFLWALPLLIAIPFAAVANRQRIALRWPAAGILLMCALAAMISLHFVVTGGPSPGYASAGIGIRPGSPSPQIMRGLSTAALVLGPLCWARFRRLSNGSVRD